MPTPDRLTPRRTETRTITADQARLRAISSEMDRLADRDLSAAEEARFWQLSEEAEGLLRRREVATVRAAWQAGQTESGAANDPGNGLPGQHRRPGNGLALARGESLADWSRRNVPGADRGGDLSFDKIVRGLATGDWRDAPGEQRAIAESPASSGGYMLPTPVAAQVIDLARNRAQVMAAGATVVPMTSATLAYPRLLSEGSPSWRTEGSSIDDTAMTFDSVTLTARSLAILIKCSWELFEDAPPTSQTILNSFAQQIALALDLAALRGSGVAPEPEGILNQTGVTITELGGGNGEAPTDYDHLLDAVQVLRGANFEPNGIIQSPRSETTLAKLKEATTNAYLQPPPQLANIPRYTTNQIPTDLTVGTSTDCSEIYVADWSQLLIGIRSTMSLQLTERYADTGQVAFLAHLRADVQLAQPDAFNVITGVRP